MSRVYAARYSQKCLGRNHATLLRAGRHTKALFVPIIQSIGIDYKNHALNDSRLDVIASHRSHLSGTPQACVNYIASSHKWPMLLANSVAQFGAE